MEAGEAPASAYIRAAIFNVDESAEIEETRKFCKALVCALFNSSIIREGTGHRLTPIITCQSICVGNEIQMLTWLAVPICKVMPEPPLLELSEVIRCMEPVLRCDWSFMSPEDRVCRAPLVRRDSASNLQNFVP